MAGRSTRRSRPCTATRWHSTPTSRLPPRTARPTGSEADFGGAGTVRIVRLWRKSNLQIPQVPLHILGLLVLPDDEQPSDHLPHRIPLLVAIDDAGVLEARAGGVREMGV